MQLTYHSQQAAQSLHEAIQKAIPPNTSAVKANIPKDPTKNISKKKQPTPIQTSPELKQKPKCFSGLRTAESPSTAPTWMPCFLATERKSSMAWRLQPSARGCMALCQGQKTPTKRSIGSLLWAKRFVYSRFRCCFGFFYDEWSCPKRSALEHPMRTICRDPGLISKGWSTTALNTNLGDLWWFNT